MLRQRQMLFVLSSPLLAIADFNIVGDATCQCAFTSGNKHSCCAARDGAGQGTGDFCGSWFHEYHCGGDTPICCTSDGEAACCKPGSTCSSGCFGGGGGGDGFGGCGCVEPPAPSDASEQYDPVTAKAFAELAQLASCGPAEELLSAKCEGCSSAGFDFVPGAMQFISHQELGDKNATFAFAARLMPVDIAAPKASMQKEGSNQDALGCVVSIRGSKNLVNYVKDAEFWRQDVAPLKAGDCPLCKVHKGFYDVWLGIRDEVLVALTSLGCTPRSRLRKVFVTGHSLGAAAATIAMLDLQASGFDVQQSYIFESPRVGNSAFAQKFASIFGREVPVFRVTNARDPVIHLPPQDFLDYTHVRSEVYYYPSYNESEFVVCDAEEGELCMDRYSLADTLVHGDDHCISSLAPGGNICDPPESVCTPVKFVV